MAIDTLRKAASAIGFALSFRVVLPVPAESPFSAADMAQVAMSFSGSFAPDVVVRKIPARVPYTAPQIADPVLRTQLTNIARAISPMVTRTEIANTRIMATDDTLLMDATDGAVTVELLPPSQVQFLRVTIKKIDASANAVTIDGTVDGVAGRTLATQYATVQIQSDGNAWYLLSSL